MFAIALWDRAARAARARARPARQEAAALRAAARRLARVRVRDEGAAARCPSLPRELDLRSSTRSSRSSTCPARACAAVEKVPPGSYAVVENGARAGRALLVAGAASGDPPLARAAALRAWIERVRDEVSAAVRRRLVADVPLGALLSGGIDSSIVVAAMAQASSEPVRTFTVGFPDPRYDERRLRARGRGALRHDARGARDRPGPGARRADRRGVRRAVRRRGGAADAARLRGDAPARQGRARRRRRRRGLRRLRALPGACARRARPALRGAAAERRLLGRAPAGAARAALDALPRAPLPRRRRGARAPSATRRLVEVFPLELRRRLWTDEALAHATRDYLPGGRRPAARRHRVVPAGRPAAEGRHRLDGRLARAALAVPRPPRRRARARAAARARRRQDGAQAGVRGRPAARDRRPRQVRASASRSTAGSARSCGRSRDDLLLGGADRGLFRRAELERLLGEHVDAARRPRAPALVPLHARALAANATSTPAGRRSPPRDAPLRLRAGRGRLRAAAPRRAPARARRHPRGVRREVWTCSRDVFLDTGTFGFVAGDAVGVHAAALRLVPDPDLLDRRPALVVARHGADRSSPSRPRCSSTRSADASSRRAPGSSRAVIATLQPYLVWHDVHVQPRDPRPAARRCDVPARALVADAPLARARRRARRSSAASRSSRTRASLLLPLAARRLPALAARPAGRRRSPCRSLAALVLAPWVVRNKVAGRVLRDHDRRARALEGEQPRTRTTRSRAGSWIDDVPGARRARLDRARTRRDAAGGGRIYSDGPRLDVDECAQRRLLPAPRAGSSGSTTPARRLKLDGAGDRAALGTPSVFETARAGRSSGPSSTLRLGRRAALRDPALPARDRRALLRRAPRSACSC